MTNPIIFEDEQYEQSFKDIVATACAAPEDEKNLAVHMWEWGSAPKNRGFFDSNIHKQEIRDILAVMANEKDAVYDDSVQGWGSRYQICDGENGLLALASSTLDVKAPCRLYIEAVSHTGLLLKNAPIVLAAPLGVASTYDEREDKLLRSSPINDSIRGNPLELQQNNNTVFVEFLNDKVSSYADFIISARAKFSKILENPRSLRDSRIKSRCLPGYNEVCVNAKLEHVSGVLVEGVNEEQDGSKELVASGADDGKWEDYLRGHKKFAERIALAFDEYDMIAAKFEEKGVTPDPVPTVVIYQPDAKKAEDRMVHFPPTEKNRAMVNDVLKAQGRNMRVSGDNTSGLAI